MALRKLKILFRKFVASIFFVRFNHLAIVNMISPEKCLCTEFGKVLTAYWVSTWNGELKWRVQITVAINPIPATRPIEEQTGFFSFVWELVCQKDSYD